MGFFDRMKSRLVGGGERDRSGYWIYVRCLRCGEPIKTRIDLRNDLSLREGGGFVVSKMLVGSQRCFERVEVTLTFDDNRQLIDRQIVRGDFITAEEFEAARSS